MTENQLKYLSYQEQARHNAATEALDRQDLKMRSLVAAGKGLNDMMSAFQRQQQIEIDRGKAVVGSVGEAAKIAKTVHGFV